MKSGFSVGDNNFTLSDHAYNRLFQSGVGGRKDIMPDDITTALSSTSSPAADGSLQYVNPETGTTVFVSTTNPGTVTGIWPSNFKK